MQRIMIYIYTIYNIQIYTFVCTSDCAIVLAMKFTVCNRGLKWYHGIAVLPLDVTIVTYKNTVFTCVRKHCCLNTILVYQQKIIWCFSLVAIHSNEVWNWCLLSQGISIPNMNQIELKTNELLMFHSGCHGNQVPIWTWYAADAYCPNEPPYQI